MRTVIAPVLSLILAPWLAFLSASPAVAQDAAAPAVAASVPDSPTLHETLAAPPNMRSRYARNYLRRADAMERIDEWIAHTETDAPQNLVMRDVLLVAPPASAGPRLTELARKAADPAIQQSWEGWLSRYPDAHASVLQTWIENASLSRAPQLLADYARLRPDSAMLVWAQYVERHTPSELGDLAGFGQRRPGCVATIAARLQSTDDATARLRLMRAASLCLDAADADAATRAKLLPVVTAHLADSAPSRRILAMLLAGAAQIHDADVVATIRRAFDDARNTTERAIALRALEMLGESGQSGRILDALQNGDEALRFEAASLLAIRPHEGIGDAEIRTAFDRELWPDTQTRLYAALCQGLVDPTPFRLEILLDEKRAVALRIAALHDIAAHSPASLTIDHLAALLAQPDAPEEILAASAETVYQHHPDARPRLRTWILAQQPFDRRLTLTFARFVHTDSREGDASAIESMRAVCAQPELQETLLLPCIAYLEANAPDDRELLDALRARRDRFDAMTQFEL